MKPDKTALQETEYYPVDYAGYIKIQDGPNYDDKDIKRRVQWGIENRQMYNCVRVDKETDKAVLALMWIPKSRINA